MTRRDASFLEELGALVELERREDRERLAELRRSLAPAERAARGLSYSDLLVADERFGLGGRLLLDLERAGRQPLEGRLGPGDPVEVRPRADEGEPAWGIVVGRRGERLTVAFDRPPPPGWLAGRLCLEPAPNEITYDRASAALRGVAALAGPAAHLREVLLGNEAPRFDPPVVATFDAPLNPEQRAAALQALAARDLFLVHGPPGTGKSTVLSEVAVQSVRRGERVLLTAPSNAAVDHLLELALGRNLRAVRIGHPARVAERLAAHTLDALVESHPERVAAREMLDAAFSSLGYARKQRARGRSEERFANAREAEREARRLFAEARALERRAVADVLGSAEVVCATLASLTGGEIAGARFDRALVDEATQAIEPIALAAALKAPRLILAGDHRQLPPTVLSRAAEARGLGTSLFERLLGDHGPAGGLLLCEQYRMHERIMAFPSDEMYGGALRAHPSVARRRLADLLTGDGLVEDAPILFIDTAGKGWEDELAPGSESHRNPGEAQLVLAHVADLLAAGLPPGDLAVIAPYAGQVALLREGVDAAGLPSGLEIDTVDAFQGREKEAVLVTFTRSNAAGDVGFLAEVRRTNVALTRARRHLFLVGDTGTLARHPFYRRVIDRIHADGGYRSAWEWPAGS